MATLKKKSNSLKIGKSVKVNKWLALGFVAAVVASAIVIVRYSGASGEVWSINSQKVYHKGGAIQTKSTGYPYWVGKPGDYVAMDIYATEGKGTYCIEGSYAQKGTKLVFPYGTILPGITNTTHYGYLTGDSGNYSWCVRIDTVPRNRCI